MGYKLAGCEVVGVDVEFQSKYPFKFVESDWFEYLREYGREFDFIHASPPCQNYSHLTPKDYKKKYERLIPIVREELKRIGKPYCIENVVGAKRELKEPVMLCGSMFDLRTQRHRYFETNFRFEAPTKCDHTEIPLLVTTASKASREKRFKIGLKPKTIKNAPLAYGIDWMGFKELKESIPPAYTKYIFEQYIKVTE